MAVVVEACPTKRRSCSCRSFNPSASMLYGPIMMRPVLLLTVTKENTGGDDIVEVVCL